MISRSWQDLEEALAEQPESKASLSYLVDTLCWRTGNEPLVPVFLGFDHTLIGRSTFEYGDWLLSQN